MKGETEMEDELRAEYDCRSLHIRRELDSGQKEFGNSVVRFDPDVSKVFPDAHSVNEALRFLIPGNETNQLLVREPGADG